MERPKTGLQVDLLSKLRKREVNQLSQGYTAILSSNSGRITSLHAKPNHYRLQILSSPPSPIQKKNKARSLKNTSILRSCLVQMEGTDFPLPEWWISKVFLVIFSIKYVLGFFQKRFPNTSVIFKGFLKLLFLIFMFIYLAVLDILACKIFF